MSFVEKEEFYKFKDEMKTAVNSLEKETISKIHNIEIVNERVLTLLDSINSNLQDSKASQAEQVKVQKSMESRVDTKLDNINKSVEDVNKSVHGHSVSIAVLQEDRIVASKNNSSDSTDKKTNIMIDYKKWWIGAILGFATTIGVAMLNNAEAILSLFGVGK